MEQKYFSVGAIFKNESHSIKEWITHYLHHGAEHFYLINDKSSDNFMEKIQEYIDRKVITLFDVDEPYYLGRQRNLYNRFILPLIKETKWLLMVDIDEYVWSKMDVNLCNVLKMCEHLSQIQIRQVLFGSNAHITQPQFLVKSFTKRIKEFADDELKLKYIVNTFYDFSSLNIHHADFTDGALTADSKFIIINPEYFTMNHYCCQSIEFWNNVKCTRGDCDNYWSRRIEDFHQYDKNDVEDLELYNQNLHLYEMLESSNLLT